MKHEYADFPKLSCLYSCIMQEYYASYSPELWGQLNDRLLDPLDMLHILKYGFQI